MEIIRSFQCRLLPVSKAILDKRYDYLALQYLPKGCAELSIAGRRQIARGPAIWFCYPGAQYRVVWRQPGERWFIGAWGTPVDKWLSEGLVQRKQQTLIDLSLMDKRLPLLRSFDQCRHSGDRRRVTLLLEELLLALHADRGGELKEADWVQQIYAEIIADPLTEPNPKVLAKRFGVGESTLRRRFRQSIGLPIHQACIHERLVMASRLLIECDDDIASIARACGFDDPAYFSRCFRKRLGLTPGAFRHMAE